METYKNRESVPDKYKWNLEDFFHSDKEFSLEFEKTKELVNDIKKYKNKVKDNLKLFLDDYFECLRRLENLYVYAYLKNDEVLGIEENISRKNKTETLMTEFSTNISYFEVELLTLDKSEFDKLLKQKELNKYVSLLKDIYRNKEHILTETEEIIVARLLDATNHFADTSSNMLNKEHNYGKVKVEGKDVEIATNNYRFLLKNSNALVRKTTYNKFYKTINAYSLTSSELLNSYVKMENTLSIIKRFNSSWEQKLFGLKLTDKVFSSLKNSVEDNLNILHKYYKIKKDILGLNKLKVYDTKVDLIESNKTYTIDESIDLIKKALKPLGDDYLELYNKVIDNHYIDFCEYKGKCSGGYSFATLDKDSRILMSFNGNLDSVSTIIHEVGHNIHHMYITKNNDIQYREMPNIVCEVASLTNECLLAKYLEDNGTTKEEKLMGIDHLLNVVISNLFGAVREGSLERDFYNYSLEGNTLTKEYLNKITKESLIKYYGKDVDVDDNASLSWVIRSHYYMNYYLYSYAICISAALCISDKIYNNDLDTLNHYKEFLKTGSDKDPLDIFKILNLSLDKEDMYRYAIKVFDNLLDRFISISKE